MDIDLMMGITRMLLISEHPLALIFQQYFYLKTYGKNTVDIEEKFLHEIWNDATKVYDKYYGHTT